jgi:hypothetical protein
MTTEKNQLNRAQRESWQRQLEVGLLREPGEPRYVEHGGKRSPSRQLLECELFGSCEHWTRASLGSRLAESPTWAGCLSKSSAQQHGQSCAVTPCFHDQPSVCRAYASIGKLARLAIDIDDYCDD